MPLSRFCTMVGLAALALTAAPALAQEEGTTPGAIPDPSTYQGSTEMQRQSDAQDQQFRQQQQQQSSQEQQSYQQPSYPQQSYDSGSQASEGYTPPTERAYDSQVSQRPPSALAAAFQRGDYATVLKILRPAAMHGNASAEHNLGYMYEKGFGVPRNPEVAASWYLKSANHGHPLGQLALGRLYFEGVGLKRDLVEAYKWTYLAGRQTARAAGNLQLIGNMLTYDQMVEAVRRAQQWSPVP